MNIIEYRIGRNIKSVPMDEYNWTCFQDAARTYLDWIRIQLQEETERTLEQWIEVHTGSGTYIHKDGTLVREDSAVFTLYTDADIENIDDILDKYAQKLAKQSDQEAIGVVVGTSRLVDNTNKEVAQ